MRYKVTTQPADEAVSRYELKQHLRVDDTDQDTVIDSLNTAARMYIEDFCRRTFVTTTLTGVLPWFPSSRFCIPVPPLVSVTSITYLDSNGDSQVLATSVYGVDVSSADQPGAIYLKPDQVWPNIQTHDEAITIVWVAGYGLAASVPQKARQAIKLLASHWYENRESVVVGTINSELQHALRSLLYSLKIMEAV